MGAVAASTAPAFDVNHAYHFVVDTPALASALQFGVSDGNIGNIGNIGHIGNIGNFGNFGNFGDNGGAYRIEVYQQSVGAVPEPTTCALMLGGLGLLGWAARRRRA